MDWRHRDNRNPKLWFCTFQTRNLGLNTTAQAWKPVLLIFQPKTILLVGYSKVIPYTKFEHFEVIHFWVMQTADKQTDKRMSQTAYPRELTEKAWLTTVLALLFYSHIALVFFSVHIFVWCLQHQLTPIFNFHSYCVSLASRI